ncbi:DUF3319 domain-containing protein [Vibrio sp. JC009]|uniref:DUF3319 domain-containing protein n=1 Tax=Vibrio sp. JC009 TaxID=2912314 RepID=UPI0023AEDC28|nr:DUF3319 domain-containing protein [Vibrio sp. JC009]WED24470.1 DUF3319 domain-containing protein [Vibrio sp. JC009]
MFKNSFFFKLIRRKEKNSAGSNCAKTTFHRSHYIKKHPEGDDIWGTKVGGKLMLGKLENVKKSIDYWYDTKVIVPPAHFDSIPGRPTDRKIVEYKGFKIINDKGGERDWYVTYKGKLLKGSKAAIEKRIDTAIQRAQARRDAKINQSIEMALSKDKKEKETTAA